MAEEKKQRMAPSGEEQLEALLRQLKWRGSRAEKAAEDKAGAAGDGQLAAVLAQLKPARKRPAACRRKGGGAVG